MPQSSSKPKPRSRSSSMSSPKCSRKCFFGGNWKMNGSKSFIATYCDQLKAASLESVSKSAEIVIACPAPYLETLSKNLPSYIHVAAQNCYKTNSGAFTGEISPAMLKDFHVGWVIIGHSERRQVFNESDSLVADKVNYAIEQGLKVIACIGETLEERESGKTMEVVTRQLSAVMSKLSTSDHWNSIVIAYEPVWAIGTGKVATDAQAQEVHCELRKWISSKISSKVAECIRIIYGGSVSKDNCGSLIKQIDIDGFLVGGASLKPDFFTIAKSGTNCS